MHGEHVGCHDNADEAIGPPGHNQPFTWGFLMPWLEWLDRKDDVSKAGQTPYRLLEPVHKLDCGDADSPNMLIEGDNLDALKALLPYYGGQVKCIYADPPFNTGQAFPDYKDDMEHTVWLSMMYPAMKLLHRLLAEDGTLFVHIDDNELGYLIAILDEIMDRRNRIAVVSFKQGAPTGHSCEQKGGLLGGILDRARDAQLPAI